MPLFDYNPGGKYVWDSWGWRPRNDWVQVPYNGRYLYGISGETYTPEDYAHPNGGTLYDTAAAASAANGARPEPRPGVNQATNAYNASLTALGIPPSELPIDTYGQEMTARVFEKYGVPLPDYLKPWGTGGKNQTTSGTVPPPPGPGPTRTPATAASPNPPNTAGGVAPAAGTQRGGVQAAPIDDNSTVRNSTYQAPNTNQPVPPPQVGDATTKFAQTAPAASKPAQGQDTSGWNQNPYTQPGSPTTTTTVGDWQNDPALLGIKAAQDQALANAKAGYEQQRRNALIGFGSQALARQYLGNDPIVDTISDNPDTSNSTLAQLAYGYRQAQYQSNEADNENNLWYSGARGAHLGALGRAHETDVANAAAQVQQALDEIARGILGAQGAHDTAISQAQADAITRNTKTTTVTNSPGDWAQNPWWKEGAGGEHTWQAPGGGMSWTIPAGQSLADAYDALFQAAANNNYTQPSFGGIKRSKAPRFGR